MAEMEVQRASNRAAVASRLLHELSPYRQTMLAALGFIVIAAGAQGIGPYLVGRAIDVDIAGHDGAGLARRMGLLLVVWIASALAQREQTRRVGSIGQRLLASLRGKLFEQLQSLPFSYFDKRAIGDLMSRLLSDVDTLNQFFSQGLMQVLGSLFALVGVLIAMLALNVPLALACFMVIPVMLVTTWAFAARARRAYRKTRETVGDVTAELQEEIVGVRQAQAFNRTDVNIKRFRQRNVANRNANVAAVGVTSAFTPVMDILSTLSSALVVGLGGWFVLRGEMTVGLVAAFLIYVQQFFRPVQLAASTYTLMQSALAGAERIFAILDETREPPDRPDAIDLPSCEGRLSFEKVSFGYDPARPVLRNVSFEVAAGQTVAIVGKTGAGKTTIASLVPRFYDATEGVVRLDGHDVRALTRASVRRRMAMVVQESFLFSGSIADNIAYGKPGAARSEVEAAAKIVRAHDFISALPKGYDSVLGEGGATLSQGQRQLLAFARAVIADPRVLILDEATASIDTRTEAIIQEALAVLLAGRTSIVIAHRLSTIRKANLILVVDAGQIVERGTHEELLQLDGVYAELYRRQFRDPKPVAVARVATA
jgi:ATP-binding cassette subfamily B protein/subfamily B ATP-binding cassette protein MsbA